MNAVVDDGDDGIAALPGQVLLHSTMCARPLQKRAYAT
jgi:hypothetical protein